MTPYPGTALFEEMEKAGRIVSKDWSRYDNCKAVFEPKRMSKETLEKGLSWANNEFYSLSSIVRRVKFLSSNLPWALTINLSQRHHIKKKRDDPIT